VHIRAVQVKLNDSAKYVELSVECLRTRVRFPPSPPPNKKLGLQAQAWGPNFLFVSAELAGIESASGTGAGWSAGFGSHASRARNDVRVQADGSSIRPFSKSRSDFAPRQRLTASSAVRCRQPPTLAATLVHHRLTNKFSRIDLDLSVRLCPKDGPGTGSCPKDGPGTGSDRSGEYDAAAYSS